MSTKYKLSYFPVRWLAEPARWIFAYSGQEYEDHRFKMEDWATIKPTTPMGQAPILYVDEKPLSQSKAICRYLAKQFGLVAKDEFDKAVGDMIVDYVDDFKKPALDIHREKDEEKKKELGKKYYGEQLPTFMANFEKILKERNGGDAFFLGSEVTWVDFYFVHFVELLTTPAVKESGGAFTLDAFPKVKALIDRVQNLPAIAEWIKKRPVTEH